MPESLQHKRVQVSAPVPDPTVSTIDMLEREIAHLKELLLVRINAIERAIDVAHEDMVRVPTDIERQVGALRDVHEEKFVAVEVQFKAASKGVEEALKSSTLAISKSEVQTAKQLDQLESLIGKTISTLDDKIAKTTSTLDDKIGDIKERLTKVEGYRLNADQFLSKSQSAMASSVGIVGLILGTLIGLAGIVMAIVRAP